MKMVNVASVLNGKMYVLVIIHTEFIALRCMDWKCTEAEVIAHFAALDVATELSPLMGKKVVKDE